MAKRGFPSTAHEYAISPEQCIYCGMYRNVVEFYKHVCTPAREAWADNRDRVALEDSDTPQSAPHKMNETDPVPEAVDPNSVNGGGVLLPTI